MPRDAGRATRSLPPPEPGRGRPGAPVRCRPWRSRSRLGRAGEPLQQFPPVALALEDGTHLVAPRPVPVQAAMLELDPGVALSIGDEAQLDLGLQARVVLPVG